MCLSPHYSFVSSLHRMLKRQNKREYNYNRTVAVASSPNLNALVCQYHAACRDVSLMPSCSPLQLSSCQCIGDNLGNTQRVLISNLV